MSDRTERLALAAVGAAKAVEAMLEGWSGVFKELAVEHGAISALLIRVRLSDDPAVGRELFPIIRRELLAHELAELRAVYPAFRENQETQPIAEHHDEEALEMCELLERLSARSPDEHAFKVEFDALVDLVRHHVKQEENEFFPTGQRVFGTQAEELLADYRCAKRQVLAELRQR